MDTASSEGELSDRACETADAVASFKYDAGKRVGFPMSRDENAKR